MHFAVFSENKLNWQSLHLWSISQPRQPQREALMSKRIISVFILRWSGLDSHHNMAQVAFRWFCQLKLPQQVALTEFSSQVNAQVGVIIVTCRKVDDPDDVASSVMSPHCSGCSPRDLPALNLNEATPTPLHLLCREVSTVLIMADNESQILYILSKQSQ